MPDTTKVPDPWGPLIEIPCRLACELEVPQVSVADVLELGPGVVLNTQWRTNRDLPLRVNGRLLAWAEFESAGENLAVRVTEFAWEHAK